MKEVTTKKDKVYTLKSVAQTLFLYIDGEIRFKDHTYTTTDKALAMQLAELPSVELVE